MPRSAGLRVLAGVVLAALLLLANGDTPRVSASGIPGTIHTVAGGGVGDGGSATAAFLSYPHSVALDAAGALYIADTGNCRVRRVSGGVITTVAGTFACGYGGDGGAATAAALYSPRGVALDAAGALYITDTYNCRVRRVSGGVITTVAGSGVCGYDGDGGAATAAALNFPESVALDAAGGLYIADMLNCRVRRVSGGDITTLAGTGVCGFGGDGGAATAAALYHPRGVALDAAGALYIADSSNCRVRRVSGGDITTVAGTGLCGDGGDGGAATAAELRGPRGMAFDAVGALYIADRGNCRVRRVSGGVITTAAGTGSCTYGGDGGPATDSALNGPQAVAVDAAGALYIADTDNYRVRRVSGGTITTVAGTGAFGYSGDGGEATAAALSFPRGVALDAAGDLYIADSYNCRVRRVAGGVITTVAGTGVCAHSGDGGAAIAAGLSPVGVAVDAAGVLYIADPYSCRVRRVSGGVITTVAGTGFCAYGGDGGAATAAALSSPYGVALGAAGDLYIADRNNCRVRRMSGGVITTVAGTGVCLYSGDEGAASAATLNYPESVALDAAGALYIGEPQGCRVRRVSGGVITTIAGTGVCGYDGDGGAATAAALNFPQAVAVDAAGELYVADTNNHRVRVVHTSPCPFDLSNDGMVGFSDLLIFAQAYNSTPPDPNWNAAADFNQSGLVGFADLLLFAGKYNDPAPNCPP